MDNLLGALCPNGEQGDPTRWKCKECKHEAPAFEFTTIENGSPAWGYDYDVECPNCGSLDTEDA